MASTQVPGVCVCGNQFIGHPSRRFCDECDSSKRRMQLYHQRIAEGLCVQCGEKFDQPPQLCDHPDSIKDGSRKGVLYHRCRICKTAFRPGVPPEPKLRCEKCLIKKLDLRWQGRETEYEIHLAKLASRAMKIYLKTKNPELRDVLLSGQFKRLAILLP